MSRLARANFKKYTDITNPLGSSERKDGRDGSGGGAWLESDKIDPAHADRSGSASGGDAAVDDRDEEEDDPFGLGAIMSRGDGSDEEDDPFGLGRIMAKKDSGLASPTSSAQGTTREAQQSAAKRGRPEAPAAPGGGAKKAVKMTGGYFSGISISSAESADEAAASPSSAAAAEAKQRPFLPARAFNGARRGYVFKKGSSGLGYYADRVFAAKAAREEALSRERARSTACGSRESGDVKMGKARPEDEQESGAVAKGRTGGKRPPVDVPAAVQKLEALLVKPKKAAKAASLMADLMNAEMRPENARLFFRSLRSLATQPASEAALAAGEGAARAFRLLLERGAEWLANPADKIRVVTWELLFGLRQDVKTDDSFQFARAIKRLREAIEALGDVTGSANSQVDAASEASALEGSSLSLERKRAIVLIMKEAFKSYHLAWARSSIEPTFKAAADRRRLFPEGELRDTLDTFTDTITKRQRNPGGTFAPPTRSVRALNSTAHPTLNKRSDVIR